MTTKKIQAKLSTNRALRRFGFRQTLRGALIIGFLVGIMMGAQGAAYSEAFPDQHSRDILVASLKTAPAVGFMAGEIKDAATPASYSIYKSIAMTTLIISIWGLMVTTRLFRGMEEDGRLEPIVAGRTTKARASVQILIGYGYSFALAFLIAWGFIAALGAAPKVDLSAGNAGLLTLGTFLPGLFFASLGVLTSQLAMTRGRALAYGLVPLLAFFVVRGAGNSISDWNDLKRYSPFGWTDLLNPVLNPNTKWIIPTLVFSAIVLPLGLYLAKRRDLGASIIPQSDHAKSDYVLLGSAFQYTVRQHLAPFIWWGLGTLAYAGLLAGIAKTGADLLEGSPAAAGVIASLGGSRDDLVVAFLGFGGLFAALILLVMAAVLVGNTRGQEAKGYLDNLLVQPVRRTAWLTHRLLIIVVMALVISLLCGYLIWQLAANQGVSLDITIVLQNATALIGTIVLLLGIGAFFYGLLPRFAAIAMYTVIIWAFIVDILKAFFKLDDWIDKTSVLHYVSFAPTKAPDWSQFAWLALIGLALAAIGVFFFAKRDVVPE
jgi:ABC-2 type transport system permease protein